MTKHYDRWNELGAVPVEQTPQEVTQSRHEVAELLGHLPAPWPYEIELYKKAGLEPPTE